ncbi:MAG: hypothetical protein KDC99_17365 [Cyclobacteriaceae bacterium]|nr:hypothetical protein [Cyclobacteriaceae bacterium]
MLVKYTSILLIGVITLSSCASGYRPMLPRQMSFSSLEGEGIKYSYRYNVLSETRNKKYANKELKHGVKLIALQVQNTTDEEVILREHARFYTGDKQVLPLDPKQMQQQVKQPGGLYMLWSLLWLYYTKCEGFECNTIPIPIGVVIGLLNLSTASRANKDLLSELISNNILDKRIAPGETVTGLLGISSDGSLPLEIRLSR